MPSRSTRCGFLRRLPVQVAACMAVLVFILSCDAADDSLRRQATTLDRIRQDETLTVITRNNSHCYYSYREQDMGFEYDLARAFADYLGVDLKIVIAEKWEGMIPSLMNGDGDLIAASMTVTPSRRRQVSFSKGYLDIRQHIIVHRDNAFVKGVQDLAGHSIHVRKGTSYQERLESLRRDHPELDFTVVLHEDVPTEELIRQVADKEIEVTIADNNVAMLNRRYYPNAIIAGPISEDEQVGWAVRPDSRRLLKQINLFLEQSRKTGRFSEIYNRYYANVEQFDFVDLRKFHRRVRTHLPIYQNHIMAASDRNGLDWRLIAAQMYQESHFNPKAKSHAGAYGLMQLTERTAESFGVTDITHPKQNIAAGVSHLKNLYDYFDIENDVDRLKIALAAYNIGQGHLRDAQQLAVKLRLDPTRWASIRKTLPLLRYRQYYQTATYGYCRGTEPINYVRQIMIYYDILKRQAIEYHKDTRQASLARR